MLDELAEETSNWNVGTGETAQTNSANTSDTPMEADLLLAIVKEPQEEGREAAQFMEVGTYTGGIGTDSCEDQYAYP